MMGKQGRKRARDWEEKRDWRRERAKRRGKKDMDDTMV